MPIPPNSNSHASPAGISDRPHNVIIVLLLEDKGSAQHAISHHHASVKVSKR